MDCACPLQLWLDNFTGSCAMFMTVRFLDPGYRHSHVVDWKV